MTKVDEIWKEIPNGGGYLASSLGRIKSPDRYVKTRYSKRLVKSIIVSQYIGKDGYARSSIRFGGKDKKGTVHRFVCLAFHRRVAGKDVVNHKNSVKDDNRAENLEWVTQSENLLQCYRQGNRVAPMSRLGKTGSKCPLSKPIICVNTGNVYGSVREAERELGISNGSILHILKGKSKLGATKNGLKFEYITN